ncbi:uncharacterized protein LOC135806298 isoform X2 [Sycon ciliatum]|uniref:uncharacterized protein LOC135806298 isoform X2 n=1 Tax=Sycon ciliatum TaxID=27933 RepID=UPI0031F6FA05
MELEAMEKMLPQVQRINFVDDGHPDCPEDMMLELQRVGAKSQLIVPLNLMADNNYEKLDMCTNVTALSFAHNWLCPHKQSPIGQTTGLRPDFGQGALGRLAPNLRAIYLSKCGLCERCVPMMNLSSLTNLEYLNLANNDLHEIPVDVTQLKELRTLQVGANSYLSPTMTEEKLKQLSELPVMSNLETFDASFCDFLHLKKDSVLFKIMPNVTNIGLGHTSMSTVPSALDEIVEQKPLKLSLPNNHLTNLTPTIAKRQHAPQYNIDVNDNRFDVVQPDNSDGTETGHGVSGGPSPRITLHDEVDDEVDDQLDRDQLDRDQLDRDDGVYHGGDEAGLLDDWPSSLLIHPGQGEVTGQYHVHEAAASDDEQLQLQQQRLMLAMMIRNVWTLMSRRVQGGDVEQAVGTDIYSRVHRSQEHGADELHVPTGDDHNGNSGTANHTASHTADHPDDLNHHDHHDNPEQNESSHDDTDFADNQRQSRAPATVSLLGEIIHFLTAICKSLADQEHGGESAAADSSPTIGLLANNPHGRFLDPGG